MGYLADEDDVLHENEEGLSVGRKRRRDVIVEGESDGRHAHLHAELGVADARSEDRGGG